MSDGENVIQTPQCPGPIDSVDQFGNGLRLQFEWQHDRYLHRIFQLQGGKCISCLGVSDESNNSEYWPVSPPIQQLSVELINGQPTALGVGATGTGHWSVSAQADQRTGQRGFLFDVALKPSKPAEFCGSSYKLNDRQLAVVSLDDIALSVVEQLDDVCTVRPRESNSPEPQLNYGRNSILTIRWAYLLLGLQPDTSDL